MPSTDMQGCQEGGRIMQFSILCIFVSLCSLLAGSQYASFDDFFYPSWAVDHVMSQGELLQLKLRNISGAGFASKSTYSFGKANMQIKLIPRDSAGTVTAFYTFISIPFCGIATKLFSLWMMCPYGYFPTMIKEESHILKLNPWVYTPQYGTQTIGLLKGASSRPIGATHLSFPHTRISALMPVNIPRKRAALRGGMILLTTAIENSASCNLQNPQLLADLH